MRNAAAHFDDDFELREPSRKKAPRRTSPGARKKKTKRRFFFNVDMKRVARYAAIGMSATVAVGIMVNALVLQKSRHPAPLFGKSITIAEANAPAPRAAPKPMAPPLPATGTPIPVVMPPARPPVDSQAADQTAPAPHDQIARLLQGGPLPAADRPDPKTVFGVQRALVRLGFVLKPNGVLGPQTKKAIELFEKDRHLPVNGDLSHRLVKILTAESGLKIEH